MRLRNNQEVREEWKDESNLPVKIMKDNCLFNRYQVNDFIVKKILSPGFSFFLFNDTIGYFIHEDSVNN